MIFRRLRQKLAEPETKISVIEVANILFRLDVDKFHYHNKWKLPEIKNHEYDKYFENFIIKPYNSCKDDILYYSKRTELIVKGSSKKISHGNPEEGYFIGGIYVLIPNERFFRNRSTLGLNMLEKYCQWYATKKNTKRISIWKTKLFDKE